MSTAVTLRVTLKVTFKKNVADGNLQVHDVQGFHTKKGVSYAVLSP